MDNVSFFNPYLQRTKTVVKQTKSYMQILPRGIIKDGERGLVKNMCSTEPRFFYNQKQILLKDGLRWPTIKTVLNAVQDDIKFHVVDAVETVMYTSSLEKVHPSYRHHIIPCGTVIHLFGKTDKNQKICVNVFGQNCYFYCKYGNDECVLYNKILHILQKLDKCKSEFFIKRVYKYDMYGFSNNPCQVFEVTFKEFKVCRQVGQELQKEDIRVYEFNVDPITRFFIDNDLPSFGWYSLQKFHDSGFCHKLSNLDLEVNCSVGDLKQLEGNDMPDYDCLTFDIECMSQSGGFPDPEVTGDIIIQISVVCHHVSRSTFETHLFTLGSIDIIPNVHIYEFACEHDLLYGFLLFLRCFSPEFLSGYNINTFDLKYIITRAVNVYDMNIGSFTKLRDGRFYTYSAQRRGSAEVKKTFSLSNSMKVCISGIVCMDMYPICAEKMSAPNYKLNTIAEMCLQQKKDDLSYKEIPVEFINGSKGRAKVGKYCIQDAMIVKDLFNKMNCHYEMSAIAKLANIPIRRVVFDGQQKRVFTCLLCEAKQRNMIIPNIVVSETSIENTYKGATVMEPKIGYYNSPVLVFDFASLYPSIIMANNLCYSTIVLDSDEVVNVDDCNLLTVHVDDFKYVFVKDSVRKSILSELLNKWLIERKHVKSLMKTCTDPVEKLLLDKRQFAIKVVCNAFYGFTGTINGLLPCVPIASSITSIGRAMLQQTTEYIQTVLCSREFLLKTFSLNENDIVEPLMTVIYGDTDSFFILVQGIHIELLKILGGAIAAHITKVLFKDPIKLEFEKMFMPLMMICKKRYIGKIEGTDELTVKGVELIRKTSCIFVKRVVKQIVDLLFWDKEVANAAVKLSKMSLQEITMFGVPPEFYKIINILCDSRDSLYLNKVDISELVLSSVLSKSISEYKQPNLPHLHVIKRLMSRKEEIPSVGDRVSYVLLAPTCGKQANYELAEDPVYVKENGLRIYAAKYFDHIVKGVSNVVSPIFPTNCTKKEKFLLSLIPLRIYIDDDFHDLVDSVQ